MSKKELKARIKELEAENLLLRVFAIQPVYIYLYSGLPYRHYWPPYRFPYSHWDVTDPITCEPDWTYKPDNHTYVSGDTSKYRYTFGVDWADRSDMTVTATGTCTVVN